MDAKTLALLCRELAENKKAEDVVVLDVSKVSSVTDYFVIASGTSEPHLRAIEHEVMDTLLEKHGIKPNFTDGVTGGNWIVADFFDVIVHIMKPETRSHYDLEGLWGDAPRVPRVEARKKAAAKAASKAVSEPAPDVAPAAQPKKVARTRKVAKKAAAKKSAKAA